VAPIEIEERETNRQAAEACARALLACEAFSGEPKHAADTLSDHPLAVRNIHLPLSSNGSAAVVRGWNDCMAFLHAYHDVDLHQRLKPNDGIKAMMFDVMEYERCVSVGADHYRGALQILSNTPQCSAWLKPSRNYNPILLIANLINRPLRS